MTQSNVLNNDLEMIAEVRRAFIFFDLITTSEAALMLVAYVNLIIKWNSTYNLTAVKAPDEILTKHIFDSLSIVKSLDNFITKSGITRPKLIDVGTGAGLPGVVLAIVRPNYHVTCIDAVEKKIAFIRAVLSSLMLKNLSAVHKRVETLPSVNADIVLSRAFASMVDFVAVAEHHLEPHGALVAMKSKRAADELTALKTSKIGRFKSSIETLTVPNLDASRYLVWLQKE